MAILLRLILPLAFIGLGYFTYSELSVEQEAPKKKRSAPRTLETEVTLLERSHYQVILKSQGVVQPHNETSLTPRVSGQITQISEHFESGAFFEAGSILVELDPTDFIVELSTAEARLARADANLAQELARAEQARMDWKDLGYTTEPTDLVLRKPQLKEAHADVKAAKASLSEAERKLERTKIRAPYAGRVKSRLVGLGQSVSPSTKLGEIFSTDFAEVRLSLSARELNHITLPNDSNDPPVPVTLIDALTTENPQKWQGQIVRTEGALDEKSRKLFLIARIDQPFHNNGGAPPLRIGQPMRAEFSGNTIPDVFIIPRDSERNPGEIYLVDPEEFRLQRHSVKFIWSDEDHLIVDQGLPEGWYLSTSRLSRSPNGARVTIIPTEDDKAKAAQTAQTIPDA